MQKNIAAFGGDIGNVTCFGESSGAGDLGSVFTADLGLCRRWIAQSPGGSYAALKTLTEEQQNGLKIASQLGINEGKNISGDLRAVAAENLLLAADAACYTGSGAARGAPRWKPNRIGDSLTQGKRSN